MVWDLRRALLAKEEFETSRLVDFEFRQRARAVRHLARYFGIDEEEAVQDIVAFPVEELTEKLADRYRLPRADVAREYTRCLAIARSELIVERGDPTPHRLG
jgi:hypothetical protein